MKLHFSFTFFLVYAIVCGIPLLTVPLSTILVSPILQQEHRTLDIQEPNPSTINLGFNSSTGSWNNNIQTEQQQHVSPAQSHDKREANENSSLSSDITLNLERLITQNSKKMVSERIDSLIFTTPKLMCPATDSENVTQNTTEFSSKTTTSMSLVNSTLGCRHFGRSTQTTTTTTKLPSVGESEIKPSKNTKTSSQNSLGVWNSSCSAEPIQRLCGCTSVCTQLNNCCYDSEFVNFDQESISNKTQYSCYENFGTKWILPSPSRLMDKCLAEWTDDSVRQQCEAPNPSDFKSYLPCHSPETDLVYKNVYCLQCNGLVDCRPWELTFRSTYSFVYDYINTFVKANALHMTPRGGRMIHFAVSPPANQEPLHCVPSVVQSCNDEFNSNVTLSKLCEAYYDPVLVDGGPYRNLDCLKCSTNKSIEDFVWISQERDTARYSTMLKFANPMQNQGKKCLGETCLPTIYRIKGYTDKFPLSVTTVNRGSIALNDSTVKDITLFWQDSFERKVVSELSGFNARVQFPLPSIKAMMAITIREEMKIEEVPQIQKKVRSVSLHVNYSDTVSVRCHVIQLGNEPTPPGNEVRDTESENSSFMDKVNAAKSSSTEFAVFLICLSFNWFQFH